MFRCDACDATVPIRQRAGQVQVLIGRTLRGVNCCPSCTRRLAEASTPEQVKLAQEQNGDNSIEAFDLRSLAYDKIRRAADHVAKRKIEAWREEQSQKIASQRAFSTKAKVAEKMGTPDAFKPLAPALTLGPVETSKRLPPAPSPKPTGKKRKNAPIQVLKKPAQPKRFA